MAYKVFTNGSVLNASDINANLMNQSVIVFSNSTARAAALTAPTEGMLTWLEDVNRYEYRNGSGAWVSLLAPSSFVLLASQTFTSATSIIIDNVFSSTYNAYKMLINTTSVAAADEIFINFRSGGVNTTTNYSDQFVQGNSSAITGSRSTTRTALSFGRFDTGGGFTDATIFGVGLAQQTYGVANSMDSSATTRNTGFRNSASTAFDGFRITLPSSTGQVRV
ncbi:hypothetical protein UFOVP546_27, partial [uncultured Caudovirales phage]